MLLEGYVGNEAQFSIEHRMLNILLLLGLGLATVMTIASYLIGLEIRVVLLCILSIVFFISCYWLSFKRKLYSLVVSIIAFFSTCIFTPAFWFLNGGLLGGSTFGIILISSILSILLSGMLRILVIGSLVLVIIMLVFLDYNYPSFVVAYENDLMKYIDMTSSLIIILVTNATGFSWVYSYYKKEEKKSKAYLVQLEQQKMATALNRLDSLNLIGEMAASIGHEVRNPLTTVRGYLQLFQRKSSFAEYSTQLNTMIEELDRANLIITEFLSLAKNKASEFVSANLNDSIITLLPLMQANAIPSGQEIQTDLGDIPNSQLDKKEIRQLLLNLIKNAIEATPLNGTITIKTQLRDRYIILSIQDTGHGIPQEVLNKLGTPFVTTKENGTGLGLPVCYRIAQRHGAQIHVESGCNGTTFHISFPVQLYEPKTT